MPARCYAPPPRLVVRFVRIGEDDITLECADGEKAILKAVTMLLAHKRLEPGDRMIVSAADADPE